MIVRVGLVVAASIAAYAVKQINVKPSKPSENGEPLPEQRSYEGDEKEEQLLYSTDGPKEVVDEEEEKEEVKLMNGIINPAQSNQLDLDDDLFPEFEDLLSGEIEFPLPSDKYDTEREEREKVYQNEMANNEKELERLRNLVKELEEREVKLEGELLEYYGLKEQESDILELQKQLRIKSVEIDMLNITINTLQAEKQKLQEEVFNGTTARKELEAARSKIKELQRQMQLEANQTKAQLLLLKQHVSGLQEKEEEKEEVKLMNGIINPAQGNQLDLDDDLFPEFEDLLSGEIEFPLPSDKYDTEREEREKVYQKLDARHAASLPGTGSSYTF